MRGVADGCQRRSITGSSSASSIYPISESPEYQKQLGDMSIICNEPLSLHNFTDSVMETKHKEAKQGNFIYSSGRTGETGRSDYQKRVVNQQFCYEWATVENREKKG